MFKEPQSPKVIEAKEALEGAEVSGADLRSLFEVQRLTREKIGRAAQKGAEEVIGELPQKVKDFLLLLYQTNNVAGAITSALSARPARCDFHASTWERFGCSSSQEFDTCFTQEIHPVLLELGLAGKIRTESHSDKMVCMVHE